MGAVSLSVQASSRIKPLHMWAGGKSKLLKHYKGKIPHQGHVGYVEPFFGGGAMFCDVANRSSAQHFVINDINSELMSIHHAIKEDCERFIELAEALAGQWNKLGKNERYSWYYDLRNQYWAMPQGAVETAASLYVLMKTGFNGLWQPSMAQEGKYGTAVGLLDKVAKIDVGLIRAWAKRLACASLSSKSYKDIAIPSMSCLIYCDPPYRSSHADYGQGFTDVDHIELINWCKEKAKSGHTVVLANRDCGDGFFTRHLAGATVHHFDVTYTVGRKKKTDKGHVATKAKEFIAVFQPQAVVAVNDEQFVVAAKVPANDGAFYQAA
jgi:DNA adenine methylase